VRALIRHRGANGEATIVGTPLRASIEDATLANGVAAHALDYDDVQPSLSGDAKFRDAAGVVLPAERVEALLTRLKTLERVADVAEIVRLATL
jgi:hypothetical protein